MYDAVKEIAGDKVDIKLVIPYGEDPHLYHAKPEDLKKIKEADLVLYHGLHFEGKMEDVLENKGHAITKDFKYNELIYIDEEGSKVVDPHFWFDIDLYKKAVKNVASELETLIPDEKENFEKNYTAYAEKLDQLKVELSEKINQIPEGSRYLITPHDAFNYFSRLFKMEVVAPQGVSTDSEVSNADIEKTAEFIVKNKIKAIFTESTTNPEKMKKLQEICKAKGFEVKVVSGEGQELYSDSLADKGEGHTYIDMYRQNVDLIVNNLK
ncbi:zinc ABC transporter substrate-binding protein [uncultured Helcococcus sp.]|uniref:metal ABC transporter solute-binding protein, Zn/Mn family n=1 Tax=uncultured Helcococcus sp. TaxID=1072508 RepID=UPI00262002E1|nr:zinc ABC transporter substrate-binding protein [uncultured Helcococcus sp.]